MKKLFSLFLTIFFAGLTHAQNSVIIFDIDTNLITTTTVPVSGKRLTGQGNFLVKLQSKTASTAWKNYPVQSYVGSFTASFTHIADSLPAHTIHEFRFVMYSDTAMTDSVVSSIRTARTKQIPQVPNVSVIATIPALPKSFIVVSYHSVGYQSQIYGLNGSNGQPMTDTVLVSGIGTDTLRIANSPGQNIASGFPVIKPQILGMNPVQGNSWNAFTAPSLVAPTLNEWVVHYKNQDSISAEIGIIGAGNGGPVTVTTAIQKLPNGPWVPTGSSVSVHAVTVGGLVPHTAYRLRGIASSSSGMDTMFVNITTLQVPAPTITVSNTQKTKNSVSFDITVNKQGNWLDSYIDSLVVIRDGVISVLPHTATNASFSGLNPGTTYTFSVYAKNKAGLKSNVVNFSITTDQPIQAIAPQWGTLWVESPSHISIRSIGYNVNHGDYAQLLVLVRRDGTNVWDTLIIQGGLTGSGTLDAQITGLFGGTKYFFKIAMRSSDGHVAVNGTERWEITIGAGTPDLREIVINSVSTNSVNFTMLGNGNGTQTFGVTAVYQGSVLIQSVPQNNLGTGEFQVQMTVSNLAPGTTYEARGRIAGLNNTNPMAVSVFFTTSQLTSIWDPILELEEEQIHKAFDIQGRFLGAGTKRELATMFPNRLLIVGGKKVVFQNY